VLERILPQSVAVVATRDEIIDAPLFALEEAVVGEAVEKRRREFTTARACARTALAQLGVAPRAIPSGPRGAPEWPTGIVGSITHCDGYCAAAVARTRDLVTIGVDAEPNQPLPDGVLTEIALPDEREHLRRIARQAPGMSWDRLLFSIKESVYKAWFPLTGRWLGFEDAVVTIDCAQGEFAARLLVPGPEIEGVELSGFTGRWLVCEGIALSAIALPVS
jgi:4'-phosphopantetheinyl transferase EntD